MPTQRYRAVFISDVHLGTADCKAEYLLAFLDQIETDRLYLVGDIVDLLAMRKRMAFTPEHEEVIASFMRLAASGCDVIYIPGNHDSALRRFCGQTWAGIQIQRRAEHVTLDGRRFLVSHGDEFDSVLQFSTWLTHVGDLSHDLLVRLNTVLNAGRRYLKLPYWSFASYVKGRIGKAAEFIHLFEGVAARHASNQPVDGFICGHIHHGAMRYEHGILYCNDGDWVDHCTALVETLNGELMLMHSSDHQQCVARERELVKPERATGPAWNPAPAMEVQ